MSTLRVAVQDYLEMRRSLGFKLHDAGIGLLKFVSFLERQNASHITVALALLWAQESSSVQPVEWARRLSFVRGFARHWSATDPRTEVPPAGLLPYRRFASDLTYIAKRRFNNCCRLPWSWSHSMAWLARPITVCWGCYP
jgi:hypothetical protein